MIRKKCKALFRSDHAPLVVPKDRQQDDDWQRDAQQPKQQSASESHNESPQRWCRAITPQRRASSVRAPDKRKPANGSNAMSVVRSRSSG
jgi:hypothetical protein